MWQTVLLVPLPMSTTITIFCRVFYRWSRMASLYNCWGCDMDKLWQYPRSYIITPMFNGFIVGMYVVWFCDQRVPILIPRFVVPLSHALLCIARHATTEGRIAHDLDPWGRTLEVSALDGWAQYWYISTWKIADSLREFSVFFSECFKLQYVHWGRLPWQLLAHYQTLQCVGKPGPLSSFKFENFPCQR